MTFNVENLFDSVHDKGKGDLTWQPLDVKRTLAHRRQCGRLPFGSWHRQCLYWDWNDAVVTAKLERIAAVIRQYRGGRGPDILVLQEVENLNIFRRLNRQYLKELGYVTEVLIEDANFRGIDVAFLSRFALAARPVLHRATLTSNGGARGILEARFDLGRGRVLAGFAVHFPAPFHSVERRIRAIHRLNILRRALPAAMPYFAAGDFNITGVEEREEQMLQRHFGPDWVAVHPFCGDCRGTSYNRATDSWSFLDMILVAPSLWRAGGSAKAVTVVRGAPHQDTGDGRPKRFALPGPVGLSDHWPLAVQLSLGTSGREWPSGRRARPLW